MALKLLTTFIVVPAILPSWLHPNIGILPGVIVPVFIEFTDNSIRIYNNCITQAQPWSPEITLSRTYMYVLEPTSSILSDQ